jgi:hypothetical protein
MGGMKRRTEGGVPPERFIGCCGAYCRTCQSFVRGDCKGCKLGYDDGQRDIARARCRIKVCCFARNGWETCAECPEHGSCDILTAFHDKKWKEYRGYGESIGFIRANGYPEFIIAARDWTKAYGELGPRKRKTRD